MFIFFYSSNNVSKNVNPVVLFHLLLVLIILYCLCFAPNLTAITADSTYGGPGLKCTIFKYFQIYGW